MLWVCGTEKWSGHQHSWLIWVTDLVPCSSEVLHALSALVILSLCVLWSPVSISFGEMTLCSASVCLPLLSHQPILSPPIFCVEHVCIRWVYVAKQVCSAAIFSLRLQLMPAKLECIFVPRASEWIQSGHYQLTGICNPYFRSDHKGLPECPAQTPQCAPTHLDASSSITTGCGCYQSRGSTWASPSTHMLTLSSAFLPFYCTSFVSAQWKPTTSLHKHFHPRFLSHLTLGKSQVHDLSHLTFYSGSAPPWRIHSSTLLGRTFKEDSFRSVPPLLKIHLNF